MSKPRYKTDETHSGFRLYREITPLFEPPYRAPVICDWPPHEELERENIETGQL